MNAPVHLHLCMLDGVVAHGWSGLVFRGAQDSNPDRQSQNLQSYR